MVSVVVVGGGYGGMAAAARLARLGHRVTLLEASDRLGGALGTVQQDAFTWESGPTHTLLPAVARDLFRTSGRPLDRELDLVPVSPVRRHRFDDGTVLDLPVGRAEQLHAVGDALGERQGRAWVEYVDGFAAVWEVLRPDLFERPWSPDHAGRGAHALLESRQSQHRTVRRTFRDERLRQLAEHASVLGGHAPRDVPAWLGVWSYIEQKFGAWTVTGGLHRLGEALADRLATRGVAVHTGTEVRDLVVQAGRVVAVATAQGPVDADRVVVAVDPRRLPALAPYVDRTMPAIPPVVAHLGIVGEVPDLPGEVVLHGRPTLVLRTTGTAPAGAHAWTVMARGRIDEDIVTALYRAGVKVRDQVEVRVDLSPRELVEQWRGSPHGVLWQGRRTFERMLGPGTPVEGVFVAGAHARTGAGLPAVGLSAALVAQQVGPAEGRRPSRP